MPVKTCFTGMNYFTFLLFIICLILAEENSLAQQDPNPGLKMAYIYRFAQYTEWEEEEAIDTFYIGIYGDDPDLVRQMLLLESISLKEKPVSIIQFSWFRDLTKTHILYITSEKNSEIERITEKISGNYTLLITDRCTDQNRIMINLLPQEENIIPFEVNKANIINEGMNVLPELLLLGGSDIDVAELYRESQDAMQGVLKQVVQLSDSLKKQNEEIQFRNTEIENQQILIDQQTKAIEQKEAEINSREMKLAELLTEVESSQQTLNQKNKLIQSQLDRIAVQEDTIEKRNTVLDLIQREIDNQQEKIEEQKSELTALTTLVERQQFVLFIFIVVCVLILGLIFFIYRSYRIKQNANRELELMNAEISKQKQEIENKNEELQKKHEEILTQSEELHQANEEILSTNEALQNQKRELQFTLENLKLTQDQLVQSEKLASVGQLTAGIAHELNNPVNFISGNVKPLRRDLEDIFKLLNMYEAIIQEQKLGKTFEGVEALKESLDYSYLKKEIENLLNGIGEGAHRSSEIVKGLRSFSRLDDEKFIKADMHDGIDSTLILLHNKTKNKIKIHKDYGDLPEIECLPSKLNQVFMNILTNSIQAIENKGDIYIETISSGIGVKICIRDTGVGMTADVKKKIFEPFYTTKEVGSGTGLGLSISYGIIEQHGGNIDVISQPGKGTEFIISLPITQSDS
jgi:signal transduction histidine kinase